MENTNITTTTAAKKTVKRGKAVESKQTVIHGNSFSTFDLAALVSDLKQAEQEARDAANRAIKQQASSDPKISSDALKLEVGLRQSVLKSKSSLVNQVGRIQESLIKLETTKVSGAEKVKVAELKVLADTVQSGNKTATGKSKNVPAKVAELAEQATKPAK